MPTNEERKETAKSLYELTKYGAAVPVWHAHLILGLIDDDNYVHGTVLTNDSVVRLADLIEPEHERTCKNLYKQRDKKGRIPVDDGVCFVCSECDAYVSDAEGYHSGLYPSYNSDEIHYVHYDIEFSYCPNCGAKVVEK